MGLFDIFKKTAPSSQIGGVNVFYELLFCDNPDLYEDNAQDLHAYPWNILFSEITDAAGLQKVAIDDVLESRIKILAYNKLRLAGQRIENKELLGVIVEVGLDNGLDVLAAYKDGTARYINQSGKIIVWESPDNNSKNLTDKLFADSAIVINQIGPWDKPRRSQPTKGTVRITFLVSDGLYFGEGPIAILFGDPLASTSLNSAAELMKYILEKAI